MVRQLALCATVRRLEALIAARSLASARPSSRPRHDEAARPGVAEAQYGIVRRWYNHRPIALRNLSKREHRVNLAPPVRSLLKFELGHSMPTFHRRPISAVRGYRPEIMFGMLVVVLGRDDVAGQS